MSNRTEELRERARGLIIEALRAAELRQGCTDYGYYAERLLAELEPVIFEYAPPPARIVQALRYGNQAPVATR